MNDDEYEAILKLPKVERMEIAYECARNLAGDRTVFAAYLMTSVKALVREIGEKEEANEMLEGIIEGLKGMYLEK